MSSRLPTTSPAQAPVPVVVNGQAGAIAAHPGPIRLTTASRALDWLETRRRRTHPVWLLPPDQVKASVAALLAGGVRRIAVGGGDGTMSSVAPLFLRHEAECVCLPLGTQNHFAKDLGIDLQPESWDALLDSRHVIDVDVGLVNGRTFLNNVAVGLYPRMVRQRARLEGEKLLGSKRVASLWATLQVLRRRLPPFDVRWEADDESGSFSTSGVLIASNAFGRYPYAPRRREALHGRQLVLFSPQSLGVRDLARMAGHALAGTIGDCPGLDLVPASTIRLHLRRQRVTATIDGELIQLSSPICVSHHERRLRAVVPERASGTSRPRN
jgi:diacylglycerol kinase family enzyme